MTTSNPEQFWKIVGDKPNWIDYVYPKRNNEEFEEEGRLEAQRLAGYISYLEKGVYIDFGCGTGRVTKYFQQYSSRMIGLDVCDKFIEIAKKRDTLSEYYSLNNFKERSIADFIICLSVFQHNDEANRIKMMKEIYDLLKPGGIAYITFAFGDIYKESDFVHKFNEAEVHLLAKDFNHVSIERGNLVRYYGRKIAPNESNEIILIARK
jgi:SAM-dependent methyltransferase